MSDKTRALLRDALTGLLLAMLVLALLWLTSGGSPSFIYEAF